MQNNVICRIPVINSNGNRTNYHVRKDKQVVAVTYSNDGYIKKVEKGLTLYDLLSINFCSNGKAILIYHFPFIVKDLKLEDTEVNQILRRLTDPRWLRHTMYATFLTAI